MASQWERLLKNQGTWVGSFTQVSPVGVVVANVPTEVTLQPLGSGDTMRQVIRKHPPGAATTETVLEYRSLGRGVLFCETGAFSQGSMQWSPVSDFGAELGLMHQHERLRVALTFPRQPELGQLTLIREHLLDTEPIERSRLALDHLIGTWTGEAFTVFPDWQPEQAMATQLTIHPPHQGIFTQSLRFGNSPPIQTQGQQVEHILQFEQGLQPVTVLCLPGGASASFPTNIQAGKPFFLEAGWLISPTLRQRIIRTYDHRGTLSSLTLVIEHLRDNCSTA